MDSVRPRRLPVPRRVAHPPATRPARSACYLCLVLACAWLATSCAARRSLRAGDVAQRAGDVDQAVIHYRAATLESPDDPKAKIALERASLTASRNHFERGRQFEAARELEAARSEYRLAREYDPTNDMAAVKIAGLDQAIRERVEAARPIAPIQQMRARARAEVAGAMLSPSSKDPLTIRYANAEVKDILGSIAGAAGIGVNYDRDVSARTATLQLEDVTFEEALSQILASAQLSFKPVGERSIFVFPDTPAKHAQYDEQVVQTFYLSYADATDMTQILSAVVRLPGIAVQPAIQPNKVANSIIVRGTSRMVQIIERIITQNDKPRAEVVFDIEILEVDRSRVKQYGLNLSEYALSGSLSPEVAPAGSASSTTSTGASGAVNGTIGRGTGPSSLGSPPPFNISTIGRGVTTSDFYMAVPTALVRFLESDTRTRVVAKPQLRGTEGSKLSLNLGDEIPIVSTSYTPIATGGAAVNPLNSFQLKPVGINVDITPRATLEGDVLIDLVVESSSRGADINVAGSNYPSFGSRKVSTKLRLRDGESNLLAGLLREDERRSLAGFPGAIHLPILKQLFSNNDHTVAQTDIVMLLTPHIIRTQGVTSDDVRPMFVGSQQNLGLGAPPPALGQPPVPAIGTGDVPRTEPPTGIRDPGLSLPSLPNVAPGLPRVTPGAPAPDDTASPASGEPANNPGAQR